MDYGGAFPRFLLETQIAEVIGLIESCLQAATGGFAQVGRSLGYRWCYLDQPKPDHQRYPPGAAATNRGLCPEPAREHTVLCVAHRF